MRLRCQIVVASCIAVAACNAPAPSPTPPPPSAARPTAAPTPTATPVPKVSTWMDAAQTPGDWFYRSGGGTTRALFGDAGAEARFAITCNPSQRTITLARAGAVATPAPLTIRTEFFDRAVTAAPSAGATPSLEATVGASDPLLDAMAFSKGRFAVEATGLAPLYLPSWPEVTRVIEDCRR